MLFRCRSQFLVAQLVVRRADWKQIVVQVQQINDALILAYLSTPTYSDTGTAVSRLTLHKTGLSETTTQTFRTAFVRPHRFRFEFQEQRGRHAQRDRCIVHADGSEFRSWWHSDPRVERHESLLMALAGPTGATSGTALRVPLLLIANRFANRADLSSTDEPFSARIESAAIPERDLAFHPPETTA